MVQKLLSRRQIIRHPSNPIPILPIGPSKFQNLVNDGVIPPPLKFGKLSFWREEDIVGLVDKIVAGEFETDRQYGRRRKSDKKLVEAAEAEAEEPVTDKVGA